MKKHLIYLAAAFGLFLAACSDDSANGPAHEVEERTAQEQTVPQRDAKEGQTVLPNGDLQEVTAKANVLPSFLKDKPDDMQLIYQAAGSATEILRWIPCYCGCGDSAGHESSMNCFVSEIREDGSVVWDDHGTRCLVCLEIAAESIMMSQEGKSLKEIRNAIDEKYKEGFAEPTPTPMPA